ncbi:MAG: TrmH family RNA methyltransferase [Trueperaceae bacterium]
MSEQRTPRHIDSAANPYVKELARLKERRGRQKSGLCLVEGTREAERALAAGVGTRQLLLAPELVQEPDRVAALRSSALAAGAEVVTFSAAAFGRVSLREHPDGVALVAASRATPVRSLELAPTALVLIVDGLEKPGNLGALMRTADAVGVDALLLCGAGAEGGGTDLENPNVIRASMGSLFALNAATGSRAEVAAAVSAAGLRLVAATPHATDALWDADLTGGVALLVGAESTGLPDWWLERAAQQVRIPMRAAAADSLNVSVAGAVLLYEAFRQRSMPAAR